MSQELLINVLHLLKCNYRFFLFPVHHNFQRLAKSNMFEEFGFMHNLLLIKDLPIDKFVR